MTQTVECFNWHIDERGTSAANLSSTCAAIVERMPRIRILRLHFRDVSLLTEPLETLTSGLLLLEDATMPLYGLVPSLIETLALLPALREIRLTNDWRKPLRSFPPTLDLQQFHHHEVQFQPGSFPALRGFSFSSPAILCAREFLSRNNFPIASLTRLFVRIPYINGIDREHIRDFLAMTSSKAVGIEDLTLWLTQSGRHTPPMMLSVESLSFADIISIAKYPHLKSFTIVHPLSLHINDEDMEQLASRISRTRMK